jgi:hypothetical protein
MIPINQSEKLWEAVAQKAWGWIWKIWKIAFGPAIWAIWAV